MTKYFSLHELVQNYTNMDKRKNSTDFGEPSRDWFINVPFDCYQTEFDCANFWHPYRKPPNLNGIRLWAPYQRLKVEEEANPINHTRLIMMHVEQIGSRKRRNGTSTKLALSRSSAI